MIPSAELRTVRSSVVRIGSQCRDQAEKEKAMPESGYRPCQCRDCMEIAIGDPDAYCWECEEANCRDYQETEGMSKECQVERFTGEWEAAEAVNV